MIKRKGISSVINTTGIIVLFCAIQLTLVLLGNGARSISQLLIQVCYSIIMACSLNLACGYLGELTLGHAGFMSIGGYTAAVLTTKFLPESAAMYPINEYFLLSAPNAPIALRPVFLPSAISPHISAKPKVIARMI